MGGAGRRAYRRLQLRLPNRLAISLAEHEAMMEALFAHDPERAAQATRDHVQV
ncbi:FCD domain-containing protein [Azospirillum agricola]|uniref:FCD domain-containing protein n=1 Tax=Azospirillum agricola TaxID=1720247 RepID=UPI000A1CBA27|nr:FCD domain-containing protein [Azospirillum agricola]